MARNKAVVILLNLGNGFDETEDYDGTIEELKFVLDSFGNIGYSHMEVLDVVLPGTPEYDEDHDPDDEFDSSHVLERVGMAFDTCMAKVAEIHAEIAEQED